MNLDEMLLYTDIQQLNNIVENYQCDCDRHSKTEMIQAVIYAMFNKETFNQLFNTLEEAEFTFLQLLYLDSRDKYTIEDLLAKGKQAIELSNNQKSPRDLVIKSLKKGWIFNGVGKKHLLVYLTPEDYRKSFLEALANELSNQLVCFDEISYYRDETNLIISDLITFLRFLINEEVLLTGEGNIYKRQQAMLFKSFLVPEEPLKKSGWRFGYGRRYNEYPDRFSLIYDYAFYQKLIYEDEQGFLYITPAGGRWLNQADYTKEELKLYQFWIRLYKHPISFLQIIIRLIDLVSYSKWVELESIEKQLVYWIKDYYYENKEQIFRGRVIKMLLHLGLLQLGSEKDKSFIRITEKGHLWINNYSNSNLKEIIL